jgi:hypothetical protein
MCKVFAELGLSFKDDFGLWNVYASCHLSTELTCLPKLNSSFLVQSATVHFICC